MKNLLNNSGLKSTKLRLIILELLQKSSKPINAYEIQKILNNDSKINISTIYRILSKLHESSIIHKVEKLNAYIICSKSQEICKCHHLFICNLCNKVIEFIDHSICEIQNKLALKNNFKTNSHSLEIMWVCNNCNN